MGHGMTESMMAGSTAVVVKIDTLAIRGGDELEHHRSLMLLSFGIAADFLSESHVDTEACTQPLHSSGHVMPIKECLQAGIELIGDGHDVGIEMGRAIDLECGEGG